MNIYSISIREIDLERQLSRPRSSLHIARLIYYAGIFHRASITQR